MSNNQLIELEQDIFFELEKFEVAMNENNISEGFSKNTVPYYEIAEIEGEKEQLQDYINILTHKNNEYKNELDHIKNVNIDLYKQNQILLKENTILNKKVGDIIIAKSHNESMEILFTEACMKLSRAEKAYQDICLSKDCLCNELEYEKKLRIHIGLIYY